ncbi:MAG: HAD-IIIC family phosphatase [Gemmatimonadota bacterium]
MYELEVDHGSVSEALLPGEVKAQFFDEAADITAISLIPWEEHCTECAMPACFATCDLYKPRKDGKCRRFLNGISPVTGAPNPQNYIARIQFKRWGELFGYANAHMVPIRTAKFIERASRAAEQATAIIPDGNLSIRGRRGISSRLLGRLKHRLTQGGSFADPAARRADYFLVEVYNPNDHVVKLSLTMRNPEGERRAITYQRLFELPPGFSRSKLPTAEIAAAVRLDQPLDISFNPNVLRAEEEGLTLYFGTLTFVWDNNYRSNNPALTDGSASPAAAAANRAPGSFQEEGGLAAKNGQSKATSKEAKTVKLLIWDLDNTLWDGILVEDGPEGVKLKPGIAEVVRELDRRGILQSIASKNDPELALAQLRRLGLEEYFLFPKINWGTKGSSVKELIEEFNIGADTVAFIDDSPFEREQVAGTNPLVRILPDSSWNDLLSRPEFTPPVTADASRRRHLYTVEKQREVAKSTFDGDYVTFLRSCEMRLTIRPVSELNVDRAHELIQRTNQLNFSGSRYTREQVGAIVKDPRYDHFGIECVDRFGEYGMVGFGVVEKAVPRLVDLMFSCRVQSKRVEHAFLSFLMERYHRLGFETFEARYRRTERNQQAGKVFSDLGFGELRVDGAETLYSLDLTTEIPNDRIVAIEWTGEEHPSSV